MIATVQSPVLADLDVAYHLRGQEIALCDARRRLAVETLQAERALIDQWLKTVGG